MDETVSELLSMPVPKRRRYFDANREAASEAGRKGGLSVPRERRGFAVNRELAARAGRIGGAAPHRHRAFDDPAFAREAGAKARKRDAAVE